MGDPKHRRSPREWAAHVWGCRRPYLQRAKQILSHSSWLMPLLVLGLVLLYLHDSRDYRTQAEKNARTSQKEAIDRAEIAAAKTAVRAQGAASVQGCARLQVIVASANRNNYGNYLLLKSVLAEAKQAGQGNEMGLAVLARAERGYTWVPLTSCAVRVAKEGTHYQLNQPVPFFKRLPAPKDLVVPQAAG